MCVLLPDGPGLAASVHHHELRGCSRQESRLEVGRERGREDRDKQERSADTFLVTEMANSKIQWTEPKDINFSDLEALRSLAANAPHLRNNGYFYHGTPAVNALLVDGDMLFMLPCDANANALTAVLPPSEAMKAAMWDEKGGDSRALYADELQVNLPHSIGLPVWIVGVCLLSYQVMRDRRKQRKAVREVETEPERGRT